VVSNGENLLGFCQQSEERKPLNDDQFVCCSKEKQAEKAETHPNQGGCAISSLGAT
jgi:hypothetical protein